MSYLRISLTTLISCLGILLTPRLLLGATITNPEFSPSTQGQSFDEIGVAPEIANQPSELIEPVVPAPMNSEQFSQPKPLLVPPIPPPSF